MTLTTIDLVEAAMGDWPDIGRASTADSFGTTYVADISEYGDTSNVASQSHRGRYLIRPTLTYGAADFEKRIANVAAATGRASIGSVTPYSTTGLGGYYWESFFKASDYLVAMQNALLAILERKTVGLGFGRDYDMMLANVNYWDGTSGSSSKTNLDVEKVADRDFTGDSEQALHCTATGANPVTKGEFVRVWPGSEVLIATIGLVAAGGLIVRYYDLDNAAYLDSGNEFTYAGAAQAYMERNFRVPDNCYRMRPEFWGSTAASEWYDSQVFGPYAVGDRVFEHLPSWVDERFKVEMVRPGRFHNQLSGVSGAYAAASKYWAGDLVQPRDFQPQIEYRAANPSKLVFEENRWVQEDIGHKPLWLQASRTASVGEPIDDFTSTTTLPLQLLLPYFKRELAGIGHSLQPEDNTWILRQAENDGDVAYEVVARQEPTKAVKRQGFKNIVG